VGNVRGEHTSPRSLYRLRKEMGLTQGVVVERVKRELPRARFSQAALSRAEQGKGNLPPEIIRALCRIYNVVGDERQVLIQQAEDIQAEYIDARVVLQGGNTINLQQRYARLERSAAEVRAYNPVMVLGPLQTAAYAATVFGTDEDSPLVQGRMKRKREITTNPRRQWFFVQTEGSLLWQARSATVMTEQLEHLIELSKLPNVRLGAIPWSTPVEVFQNTAFHIYDVDAVVVGTRDGTAIMNDRTRVVDYRSLFQKITALASFDDKARTIFQRIADQYRSLI